MRIISGILKGRPIRFPADIRPTQNKVRKAVFDCLAQAVEGAEFLELFAGSGAVGIEAISCGAKRVTFVDNDFNSLKAIESNLKELDLDERHYRIVRSDAFKFLDDWAGKKTGFDIIFSDPPYRQFLAKNCLLRISACDILNPSGILVIEHHKKEELPQVVGNGRDRSLLLFKQKSYGDKILSFYEEDRLKNVPEGNLSRVI